MPKEERTALQISGVLNDALIIAGQMVKELQKDGHINTRFEHQMTAQLNSVLYTLAFALPPGTLPITLDDTGDVIGVTTKVETPKRQKKA